MVTLNANQTASNEMVVIPLAYLRELLSNQRPSRPEDFDSRPLHPDKVPERDIAAELLTEALRRQSAADRMAAQPPAGWSEYPSGAHSEEIPSRPPIETPAGGRVVPGGRQATRSKGPPKA